MLNFIDALRKLKKEDLRGTNPVPDILGFQHVSKLYENNLDQKMNEYFESILKNTNIRGLLKIDVPKANFTIRPMSRPHLEEWLIYESISDALSKLTNIYKT